MDRDRGLDYPRLTRRRPHVDRVAFRGDDPFPDDDVVIAFG